MENLDTREGNMLDLKEEQKYTQLRKLGQELHLPIPEHFITLEVFDKDGKLLQRHHQRSHSWVRNAYNLLFTQLAGKGCTADGFGAGKVSGKKTDGSVVDTVGNSFQIDGTPDSVNHGYLEAAGVQDHGILVGSGVNAENFEDFVLQTLIVEGAGAGELNHIQSEANDYSYGGLVGQNVLIRYFNNNSGGDVLVNEAALVMFAKIGAAAGYYVMSRDKLGSTVTVPDTGQLKVTYTIQLTYPA